MKQIILMAVFAFGCNTFGQMGINTGGVGYPAAGGQGQYQTGAGFNPMVPGSLGVGGGGPMVNLPNFFDEIKRMEEVAKKSSDIAVDAVAKKNFVNAEHHLNIAKEAAARAAGTVSNYDIAIKYIASRLKQLQKESPKATAAAAEANIAAERAATAIARAKNN